MTTSNPAINPAISAEEVREVFDEIGDAIAFLEARYAGRGLDREADGVHHALAEIAKIRTAALRTHSAPSEEGRDADQS